MPRHDSIVFTLFAMLLTQSVYADTPPDVRTIMAFHRSDFRAFTAKATQAEENNMLMQPASGLAWTPLFDGTAESSLMIAWGMQAPMFDQQSASELQNATLLTIDRPPLSRADAALVGRWSIPTFRGGSADVAARTILTLKVDYADATAASVVSHLTDLGDSMAPVQNFRLPIKTSSSPVQRLTLLIETLPNLPVVLEDVRLVESGANGAGTAMPPAGVSPIGQTPVQPQAIRPYDFEPWASGQGGNAPVVIDDTSAHVALHFMRRPGDGSARRVPVISLDAPPVSAGDFGVSGSISYTGIGGVGDFDGRAWFELIAFLPDGSSRVVGTTAPYGPCQLITGHSGSRPMLLAMHSSIQPTRLQLQLVSDGVGQIAISDLSIVQFVLTPSAATSAPPIPPSHWADSKLTRAAGWSSVLMGLLLAICTIAIPRAAIVRNGGPLVMMVVGEGLFAWAMYLLGRREVTQVIAPLFAGAVAWVLPVLARRLVFRRQHERELRQILTIDAT